MLLTAGAFGYWYKTYQASLKGTYDEITGAYENKHYGFSLKVPASWRRYSAKDAIECQTIVSEYADNYFFLASPTEPAHSMIVVQISGITADRFKSKSWESFVADTASRHQVVFNATDTIENTRVYRCGYMIQGAYREDNFFIANDTLFLIYFYVATPEQTPELLQAMKESIQTLTRI